MNNVEKSVYGIMAITYTLAKIQNHGLTISVSDLLGTPSSYILSSNGTTFYHVSVTNFSVTLRV